MTEDRRVPRTLWLYWEQGWDRAPAIVKQCATSWRHHNVGWTIHFLDRDTVRPFFDLESWLPRGARSALRPAVVSRFIRRRMKVQWRADIIRINLLHEYGGVWADATAWCHRPLDAWIDAHTEGGFFAFTTPKPDGLMSNWFLAAPRDSYIVETALDRIRAYWDGRDWADNYFWFHRAFSHLYHGDDTFRALWDQGPKISSDLQSDVGPFMFWPYREADLQLDQRRVDSIMSHETPVYKLAHDPSLNLASHPTMHLLFSTLDDGASGET